jgi:F-type H+-transporting ATPase subunit epsilon
MNDTMKIEIATSAGIVYTADARMVTLPAADGRISIFAHHMPMLTRITPGELIVRTSDGQDDVLAVGEGLVAVTSNHIGIVTDSAIAGRDAQVPVRKQRRS